MAISRALAGRSQGMLAGLSTLVALSAGCGGSGGGKGSNGAYFTIESEGTGVANAAPLDPLVVGTRRLGVDGDDAVLTGETVGDAGERVIRYQSRRNLAWVVDDDDGFFTVGTGSSGPNGAPILYAPRSVRVGMRWVTFNAEGKQAFTFEVTERNVEATPFGEAPVWTIEQRSQHDEPPALRRYAEGIGLLSIGNVVNTLDYKTGFLPTKTTLTKKAGSAQTLDPFLVEGKQAEWPGFEATWITSIDDNSAQTIGLSGHTIVLISDGNTERNADVYAGRCSTLGDGQLKDTEFTPPNQLTSYTHTEGAACLGVGQPPNTFGVAPQWSDATGAVVNADHSVDWIPRDNGYVGMNGFFPGNTWFANYQIEGKTYTTWYNYDAVHLYARTWGETDLLDQSTGIDGGDGLVGLDALQQLEGSRDSLRILTPPVRTRGKSVPVAMISNTGLVSHTLTERQFTPPIPQLALNGELSVRATAKLREGLSVSYDGDISRVVVDDDGVHLQRLAHVAIGNEQKLVGALRTSGGDEPAIGDELLVFTYTGRTVPRQPLLTDVAGPTQAWTAKVTELTDLAGDDLVPALAVSAQASGFDAVVCYPPSDEALETTGWKLGGAPATQVIATGPESNCALIVRDHVAALDVLAPGGFAVEGPVPGVGVMRIAMPSKQGLFGLPSAEIPHAALKDGGLVSHWQVYAPGALALDAAYSTLGFPFKGLPDRAGNGLWLENCPSQAPVCARTLVGRKTTHFDVPEQRWGLRGVAGDGGAIFEREGLWELLTADGKATPLVDDLGLSFAAWGVADGVACHADVEGMNLACVKDGVVTATPIPYNAPGGTVAGNYGMYSLADGSFITPLPVDGTWRLDPEKQTFAPVSAQTFRISAYGADGSLWALLYPEGKNWETPGVRLDETSLVHFTPEGPEPFDTGLPHSFFADSPLVNFAVDEAVIVLFRDDGAVVRVAR